MTPVRGNHTRWKGSHYLALLALFTCTSAVQLSDTHRHDMNTDLVTVGEFQFCARSNISSTTRSLCKDPNKKPRDYVEPSVTAIMVGIMKSMQWVMGLSPDWLSACFVTTEYERHLGCECTATNHKPNALSVMGHAIMTMLRHPVEAVAFLGWLQGDVYLRTQVIDAAMKRTTMEKQVDQVVILGAGYDTRPYRHGAGMMKVPKIFETDLTEGHKLKMEILKKCGVEPVSGEGEVFYEALNLNAENPFTELWQHKDFSSTGHSLIISEQVFGYLDIFSNMNWLRTLASSVRRANGTATLILIASRGPNFDSMVGPRCWNFEECLKSQLPQMKEKSDAFMAALGWKASKGYDDLEKMYLNEHLGFEDDGYMGVFQAGTNIDMSTI